MPTPSTLSGSSVFREYGSHAQHVASLALCDRQGPVHHSSTDFNSLLCSEWPGWGGRRLPGHVLSQLLRERGSHYRGKIIRLDARAAGDFLSLRARRISNVDHLSPRELEVARLFGKGCSHKEIARELNISPATVRHHLSGIYARLGVHDKAQLAHMMHR